MISTNENDIRQIIMSLKPKTYFDYSNSSPLVMKRANSFKNSYVDKQVNGCAITNRSFHT